MVSWLLGVLVGDGTIYIDKKNGRYMVWIDQHLRNREVIEMVEKEFRKIHFKPFKYRVPSNKIRILIYSKEFCNRLREIKKSPEKYFKSLSNNEKLEFISGFYDAEGTITDRIVIYNKNYDLLEEIKKFLETLQIESSIYRFGKVFGLQIHKKSSIKKFIEKTDSIRLRSSPSG